MDTIGAAFLAAVAAAVLVALVPAEADSGVPAPLKQMAAGAEAGDILCNSGRVLMISPGGTPACAFPGSADALVGRGWTGVPAGGDGGWQGPGVEQGGHDSGAPASGYPEPRYAGQDRAAPAPHPAEIHDDALAISGRTGGGVAAEPARPHAHHNTLTISKYPVVGEVADVTFTVTVAHESGYSFGEDFPLARLMTGIGISGYARPDSSFDMVSNIGTGDPGVFRPYDPDNVTTVARPGETYTVKAKFSVPEEEVVKVYGLGLHGDIAEIYIAASKNRSMPLNEYEATGQTYLDHMMAAGHEEPPSLPEYDIDLTVPYWPVNRTTLLGEYHAMYSSFAEGYASLGYTEDQIVEELFFFGHLRSDIREFFVHIMNYTEEQAGAVRMGDDLLGFAYMASPAGIDDVVHDMLTRRNYTAAEARDLLRDHMFYTDDEAAALVLNATATRAQAGAAGQQQQQQQQPRPAQFAVSGKVHGTTYGGTQAMPVHGIRVCAYDHDDTTMRETLLRTSSSGQACTVTAQSGTYAIVGIRNDDPDDDTTVDLLVRVLSEGSRLSVAGTSGAPYRHDEPAVGNFNGTMFDRDITLSGPSAGAGRIIDAISDGRRFFEGHRIGVAPLTVKWQHDAGAGAFSDRSSDSAAYGRSGNIIWLNGNGMMTEDDSHERWTLLHEFGHHVMDAAGRFPAGIGCPSPHYLHNQSGAGCAWTEGWADFVPHMVDNSANLRWTDDVYVDLEQDRTENGTGEARNTFARTGPTGGEGHLVEGQVAAALWDVKDSRVDTKFDKEGHNPRGRVLDDLAMGDDEIVGTFRAATYVSFGGFYDAWESARAPAHSARNVMDLHAMGFAGGARPLADPFGGLDKWSSSGTLNWSSGAPLEGGQPPGHLAGNTVARARHCAAECVLTLRDGVDLSGFGAAELSLWRFVDNYLGSGDYLRVDVSPDGGSSWSAVRTWGPGSGNDDRWHREAIPLAPYLNSTDFKVRLSARLSYQTSDAAVDDVVINGTARARAGGPVDVLSSGFDASLEGWAYRQVPAEGNNRAYCGGRNSTAYSLSHSQQHGGSAYVDHTRTCWFGAAGMAKTFDVPASLSGTDLNATARFQSFTGLRLSTGGHTNNLHMLVSDSSGNVVASGALFQGLRNTVVRDTGLQTVTLALPSFDAGRCPCTAFVHLHDHWRSNWDQRFYLDDLRIEGRAAPDTCEIRLAKNALDVGPIVRGTGVSGFDTQTVHNDGSLPVSSLSVAYSRITGHDARGGPTPFTLPPSGAEVRSPAAGFVSWTPASSLVQFGPIPVGGSLDIQYRFNLGGATVIPSTVSRLWQTATYNAVCAGGGAAEPGGVAAPPSSAPARASSSALIAPDNATALAPVPQGPAFPTTSPATPTAPPPPPWAGPGVRGLLAGAPPVHSTLKTHELLGMHASNGTRIMIVEKYAYDADIVVDWEDYPGADRYKVVVHRADSPHNRTADGNVTETRYRLAGLEPSTEYVVRVGVRGDDSTQSSVRATTLPAGSATLPSGLRLDASLRPASDRIDLGWDDANGIAGGGGYRLELSVDGGPFGPSGASRTAPAGAEQAVRPGWLGSTLTYRVSERIGPQQLLSDNASVRIPGALQAPPSLSVVPSAASGGIALTLDWDHSPLFRHYVVETQGADGSWERIGRTQGSSFEYAPSQGDGIEEYSFRVHAQLGSAASPPSDTATARTVPPPPPPPGGGVAGAGSGP